jgi:dephospho-CoA kinase
MPCLAITGTIGSGKSQALTSLALLLHAETFSADEENRRLLDEDAVVRQLLISHFGIACYQSNGKADRAMLSELIRLDQKARKLLESILHPRIQERWKPRAAEFHKSSSAFFIAEIPLLYENHLEVFFDKILVIGCSDSLRRERLFHFRSLTPAVAESWATLQDSQESKITRADYLLWNDGSEASLQQQLHLLASHLLQS